MKHYMCSIAGMWGYNGAYWEIPGTWDFAMVCRKPSIYCSILAFRALT